ncbi:MAG: rod shape-determining protein MreD [Gammaproteobacteria bacterium]|nr:MAG: rod shape-determining protein MreD [Gammaproteobacteria bacterium]
MSRRSAPAWPVWLVLLGAAALMSLPLPAALAPFRPPWASMAVIYWVMMWPRRFGPGSAWLIGLLLDVLQGDILGQHAFSLCILGYLTLRFHLQIRIFPLWQLTATVFALLALEAFLLFWIDGMAGNPPVGIARWSQVLVGGLLWPPVMALLDRIRERLEQRDRAFA